MRGSRVAMGAVRQSGWQLMLKRAMDRLAGAAGLALASPVLAATALAIRATMGSPVLFTQPRTGYRGRAFDVIKFRTMRDAVGPDGRPLPDVARLTRLGQLLRSTSLDELPQLVNVLRGELSLVGPRPLMHKYAPLYAGAAAALRGAAGDHGLGADQRPQLAELAGEVPARRLVRRPLEPVAGSEDPGADGGTRGPAQRCVELGDRDDAGVPRRVLRRAASGPLRR